MTNLDYRKSRGTHKPFRTTEEQADAIWAELYPEVVARAKARKKQGKRRTPWASFTTEDED